MTPHVHVMSDGTREGQTYEVYARHGAPTGEEAVFAVDFATRALLRLEEWVVKNPKHLAATEGAPNA